LPLTRTLKVTDTYRFVKKFDTKPDRGYLCIFQGLDLYLFYLSVRGIKEFDKSIMLQNDHWFKCLLLYKMVSHEEIVVEKLPLQYL